MTEVGDCDGLLIPLEDHAHAFSPIRVVKISFVLYGQLVGSEGLDLEGAKKEKGQNWKSLQVGSRYPSTQPLSTITSCSLHRFKVLCYERVAIRPPGDNDEPQT